MTDLTKNAANRKQRMAARDAQWLAADMAAPQPARALSDLARHALERKTRMDARAATLIAAE